MSYLVDIDLIKSAGLFSPLLLNYLADISH